MMFVRPVISGIFLVVCCYASRFATAGGNFYFKGAVVKSGCWQETSLPMIMCQRKNKLERHIIIENLNTAITSPNATIQKKFLDEDKQLTLLLVVYD